ncbi:hypothetical protein BV25DRAFT_1843276 [Artomyces pyxidatus]|uniref:Uncharacterized protein n=1 Tax=Artomyces pyxidatus TaxID=48021 RepID=A0ACB8SES7_9AGAM|nr:hypothetical protein BV25DRAFT_1843276 [Artomyces pyxidatus]
MWATAAQLEWMRGRLPDYRTAQATRKVKEFWPVLYSTWFGEWPETDDLGKDPVKGMPDQRTRLKQWFNNHLRATSGLAGGAPRGKVLNLIGKPKRKRADYQVYQKLYWEDKLKIPIEAAWDKYLAELPDNEEAKSEIVFRNEKAREMLLEECDEVKAKVQKVRNGDESDDGEGDDEDGDGHDEDVTGEKAHKAQLLAYRDAIERLPATAEKIVDKILAQTGWTFATAYPDFKKKVQAPFRDYLHRVYPAARQKEFLLAELESTSRENSCKPDTPKNADGATNMDESTTDVEKVVAPETTGESPSPSQVSAAKKTRARRLTPAELEREKNIKRNQALLDELGVRHALHFPPKEAKTRATRKRKADGIDDESSEQTVRKSQRLKKGAVDKENAEGSMQDEDKEREEEEQGEEDEGDGEKEKESGERAGRSAKAPSILTPSPSANSAARLHDKRSPSLPPTPSTAPANQLPSGSAETHGSSTSQEESPQVLSVATSPSHYNNPVSSQVVITGHIVMLILAGGCPRPTAAAAATAGSSRERLAQPLDPAALPPPPQRPRRAAALLLPLPYYHRSFAPSSTPSRQGSLPGCRRRPLYARPVRQQRCSPAPARCAPTLAPAAPLLPPAPPRSRTLCQAAAHLAFRQRALPPVVNSTPSSYALQRLSHARAALHCQRVQSVASTQFSTLSAHTRQHYFH